MAEEKDQWYTNKQLFEMIQELWHDTKELRSELQATRVLIKEYNGLRTLMSDIGVRLGDICKRVDIIENTEQTKAKVGENTRDWVAWAVALLMSLITLGTIFANVLSKVNN